MKNKNKNKNCSVATCDDLVVVRGWCTPHYRRWYRTGDPEPIEVIKPSRCATPGCQREPMTKGVCSSCYPYIRAGKDPSLRRGLRPADWNTLDKRYEVKESGCWEWTGPIRRGGYGAFTGCPGQHIAHRAAYQTWVGPIPEGHVVRHKCDNPPCINPEHLETGTPAENNRDTIERGRDGHTGERNAHAKLTNEDVLSVRADHEQGLGGYRTLARKYGVTPANIRNIVKRVSWRHI